MCQRWASGAVCYRGIVRAASSLMGGEAQRRSIAARADSALAKYRQRTALSVRLSSASANGIARFSGCAHRTTHSKTSRHRRKLSSVHIRSRLFVDHSRKSCACLSPGLLRSSTPSGGNVGA